MNELKEYRVRVTEKHSDILWVMARSAEEAKETAAGLSECEYECLYDCEVIDEKDLPEDNETWRSVSDA